MAAEVTDANFDDEVLKSTEPVLVDLWAPWCGPCRMLTPIIEKLEGEYKGKVRVFKLNTDDNPNTATKYRIQAIPTLLFFKGGGCRRTYGGYTTRKRDPRETGRPPEIKEVPPKFYNGTKTRVRLPCVYLWMKFSLEWDGRS